MNLRKKLLAWIYGLSGLDMLFFLSWSHYRNPSLLGFAIGDSISLLIVLLILWDFKRIYASFKFVADQSIETETRKR